ncbi:multidrug effflux MFS transporter [Nitratireductor sp. ZSWI3]|uniref:multidrug effflux MFS transporter n=1 Tax=Nitratireductor sp. ZSWI3 TaxID=2966359 RepID=UPI00214F67D7|nr:multidrug effflux MFS transporter [Nitratireductor sp. ZSWI3]MCR4267157.1 multidrug effflux MFS transporter [Nitratireductor sp. ZSWI3]
MKPGKTSLEQICLYALLTSLTALSIDAVLPALRFIESDLQVRPPLSTQHIVSLFIFGMVFGELLIGPLSDAIGRKKALVLGLAVYMAGTLVAMSAGSVEMVVFGRILQGIGVSGPKIATRALIRDQFEGDAMARIMSFVFVLFILVPMLAPALGQLILAVSGWRAIFLVYLAMAVVLCAWLALRQPETLAPQSRIRLHLPTLLRNAGRVLRNRRVALLIVATGLVFGAQLQYLSTAADVFFDVYGISGSFPAYFAALAAGIGLASLVNAGFVRRYGMQRMSGMALAGLALLGALLTGVSLVDGGHPPLAALMGLGFAIFFCIGILFGNLNAMAMLSLGQLAGLGASLIASGSSLVAVVFSVAFGTFYDGTTTPLALGFALAGLIALILVRLASRASLEPVEPIGRLV